MNPKHYLCVFHVDEALRDLGLDPDFSAPSPTWGICRPQIRTKWISKGSLVVFVAFHKEQSEYWFGGWIRVGEILGYEDALHRFPNRRNVIIRRADVVPQIRVDDAKWKTQEFKRLVARKGEHVGEFLTCIRASDGGVFVQSPDDDHEIDNWKCQRIFLCQERQFKTCLEASRCLREREFDDAKGYVIADQWMDATDRRIRWASVAPESLVGVSLATPKMQHNARRLYSEDIRQILIRAAELV